MFCPPTPWLGQPGLGFMMIRLRLLGSTDLRTSEGEEIRSVLVQSKRFALLAYLACTSPSGFQRRDKLLGLFWPEIPQQRARASLSQSLYFLRKALGPSNVLTSRGSDEVGLRPGSFWCDVVAFQEAYDQEDWEKALEIYRGDLLAGFHTSGAPEFEHWLESERERFRELAAASAWSLADARIAEGELTEAERVAQKALFLAPTDESPVREFIETLARAGDRGAALRFYDKFEEVLLQELEVEPASETARVAEAIRNGEMEERAAPERPAPGSDVATDSDSLDRFASVSFSADSPEGPGTREVLPSGKAVKWKRIALWAAATAVVVAGLALNHWSRGRATEPIHPRTAIAVLPFRAQNAGEDYAFVAPALQDELRTHLSEVEDLKVVGRRSVLAYAGPGMSLDRIAHDLGVGSVIEASVWIVDDRLRVAVELLDAVSGRQLWANVYERTLDNVFAVQTEIAREIVREVGVKLTRAEARALAAPATENPEAYQLYLRAEQYRRRPGRLQENLLAAQQLYERALELDPSFALAHARLAEVHAFHINIRWDPTPARRDRMLEEAETALRLAPDLAQAHIAMGLVHYYGRMDYAAALEEFELALDGQPNDAEVWKWIGFARRRMADWEGAVAAFEEARELDPWHFDLFSDLGGITFWITHRYAEAVGAFHRAWEIAPDAHSAAVDKGWMYVFWRGEGDTLRAVLESLPLQEEIGLHLGTVASERARLLLYERRGDSLLSFLARGGKPVFDNQAEYLPSSLYRAWAQQLRNEPEAARAAFQSSLTLLDSVVAEMPDHWPAHAARGLTLAGLGRSEEALAEARWLEETAVYRKNATIGMLTREYRAYILAQAGEAEEALDEIENLIQGPSLYITPHTLAADPRWDPIREHPRFRALMKDHEGAGIR